jgi:hypothetical protein
MRRIKCGHGGQRFRTKCQGEYLNIRGENDRNMEKIKQRRINRLHVPLSTYNLFNDVLSNSIQCVSLLDAIFYRMLSGHKSKKINIHEDRYSEDLPQNLDPF